ncbi:MAG: tRNA (N(6)-L-threonylcarbamoyladenosine(37)-C(2))-methylthiotransferase MtaB [Crocinitomicaceae bacterium TMED114]|nr:MAG: tRNA (N(6)-L-threonylcarbamoyladenosine(37)-C(2))-methylthiotransferase MtaB [Crocinitomicaceae bacterium TMED114]
MANHGRVAFETLGCKLNFSESSALMRGLVEAGYAKVAMEDRPDVVVVNTCSVTDHADAKCRNIVRRAKAANPDSFVAVIGCYAQLKPKEISGIDGVDLVLGAQEKFNLAGHLEAQQARKASGDDRAVIERGEIRDVRAFHPAVSSGDRTRSFLKVQDGCDYFCAFCTIPLARGRSRSADIATTLAEARKAAESGAREIVLTGVNIGDFGKAQDQSLLDLCRALDEDEGLASIERFRISSIEPNLLDPPLIDFVADSQKFQPHFHIPLQSGSDAVLSAMRRRYRTDLYRDRLAHIVDRMPEAGIGIDVIVGFPGETEVEFAQTRDFLLEMPASYLHVFTYSERPKTTALRIEDVVLVPERKARNKVLTQVSLKKQWAHAARFEGRTRPVLLEGDVDDAGCRSGYTPEYVRVAVADTAKLAPGTVVNVELGGFQGGRVQGALASD